MFGVRNVWSLDTGHMSALVNENTFTGHQGQQKWKRNWKKMKINRSIPQGKSTIKYLFVLGECCIAKSAWQWITFLFWGCFKHWKVTWIVSNRGRCGGWCCWVGGVLCTAIALQATLFSQAYRNGSLHGYSGNRFGIYEASTVIQPHNCLALPSRGVTVELINGRPYPL